MLHHQSIATKSPFHLPITIGKGEGVWGWGLNWYACPANGGDYGARMYDPQLARFHTLDPLAEEFGHQSPFVYADNSPVRFIDFMGMNSSDTNEKKEEDEETKKQNQKTSQPTYTITVYGSSRKDVRAAKAKFGNQKDEQAGQDNQNGGRDGWHPPMALTEGLGILDLGYGTILDQFPNLPNGYKYFGTGLSSLTTGFTGYSLYKQYQKGGLKNVNPFLFSSFTVGSTALLSKSLEWAGYRSLFTSVIGRSAGVASLGILTTEIWFNLYKSMNDLRFAPSYIDANGQPYWGDPKVDAISSGNWSEFFNEF